MLKKPLTLLILALLLAACTQDRTLKDAVDARFVVGDEWTYRTRAGEGLSTFTVLKIDQGIVDGEETIIVHISVNDLAIEHPDGGQITAVPHMPFTLDALNRSAGSPFNIVDPLPQESLDGYQKWREQYEAGEGEVFQTTIATALNSLEESLQAAQ